MRGRGRAACWTDLASGIDRGGTQKSSAALPVGMAVGVAPPARPALDDKRQLGPAPSQRPPPSAIAGPRRRRATQRDHVFGAPEIESASAWGNIGAGTGQEKHRAGGRVPAQSWRRDGRARGQIPRFLRRTSATFDERAGANWSKIGAHKMG